MSKYDLLGVSLKTIRKDAGYKSARAFYINVSKRENLSFNYSYYALIEQGKVLPSFKIIEEIGLLFSKNKCAEIILIYCRIIFPNHAFLFDSKKNESINYNSEKDTHPPNQIKSIVNRVIGKKELTLQQVSVLSKSKHHYFLFFLFAISRRPISKNEITLYFKNQLILNTLDDLVNAKIITSENDLFQSTSIEFQFPNKNSSKELEILYKLFDQWDIELPTFYRLENKKINYFFVEALLNN